MFSDRPRWLYIFLALSVLVNLFLAGFVVGRLSFPAAHVQNEAGAGAMVARSQVRDLPVMERIRFGLALRRHASELRETRDQLRDARAKAEQAITAQTYDDATGGAAQRAGRCVKHVESAIARRACERHQGKCA